ncbi:hypothetical protein EJ05DRAFT_393750 [Pseudovirgaria hyperparasitica]|uniref:Uncharacterized protein n=1 Tax=Pseudovirgaria hyperparasitica TaxID=470096 RepID=A0A6A6W8Y2_9PEZI|nr:uncharacterized protein EJ05DRAFT_393750 [Pseudovirgaria hyperparasitica]KAF2757551.1 hypothetical protein EJ05DRAFT_393750 [Pseudovirgaria hyperparasitica]
MGCTLSKSKASLRTIDTQQKEATKPISRSHEASSPIKTSRPNTPGITSSPPTPMSKSPATSTHSIRSSTNQLSHVKNASVTSTTSNCVSYHSPRGSVRNSPRSSAVVSPMRPQFLSPGDRSSSGTAYGGPTTFHGNAYAMGWQGRHAD